MLLLVADENFNGNIVRGLFRRQPALDLVRLQDVGLSGADDPAVLAWAAQEERVLLTHDVSTITRYAYERVQEGQPMPGVFEVSRDLPIGRAYVRRPHHLWGTLTLPLSQREGATLSCRPSAVVDAGNGAPLNWRPSAVAVAGR